MEKFIQTLMGIIELILFVQLNIILAVHLSSKELGFNDIMLLLVLIICGVLSASNLRIGLSKNNK